MRIPGISVGTALALCLMLTPLAAASNGKGQAPVKVSSPKALKAPKATAPKMAKTTPKVTKPTKVTTTAKASSTPKTTTKPTKTTTTSETKLAKPETSSVKAKAETKSVKSSSTASTTAAAPTGPIDFTTGKVGEHLTRNPKLAEKLGTKLTAMGHTGDVFEAAYGFKNFGQFNAAVNNAQNHGLSFEQLKTLMTGVSVDSAGVVLYANRNPDGTVTMVPRSALTNPAPTTSLGQAKKTISNPPTTVGTTGPR
jgi:hypothetical protein